ncbi:carboxymuconolactone decarboxylase family protein [Mycolicibacterium pyrenivorans]|uniref:carboxymuconolactone decarboxylase family protein n=1 Tax=Mycolicibacterium pyrenivorans TaxID=187102 RepID=UPI0021F328AE|nr:carboxymuconolactone decarboxylase family protein [Mycolicibacterium pyrenivorans]MCV7153654.1 carboxymuconolactone decarboxylase family protein [Mycolicibacterium pyrenivorans]
MASIPRLEPLPAEEWDDDVRSALSPLLPTERANPRDAGNIVSTLVRNKGLTRAYLEFNAHLLLHSTVSARVREVALLRAVHLRGSEYLWDHHVPIAQRAGLTVAEIQAVRTGEVIDQVDAVVVRAVDELEGSSTLTDATWSHLREQFDEQQVLDLVFTVGCYQLLAVAVRVFGIQPEEH